MKVIPTLRSRVWVTRSYVYCKQPIFYLTYRYNFAKVSSVSIVFLPVPTKQIFIQGKLYVEIYKRGRYFSTIFSAAATRKEGGRKERLSSLCTQLRGARKQRGTLLAELPETLRVLLSRGRPVHVKRALRLRDIAPPFGLQNRATSCPFFAKLH